MDEQHLARQTLDQIPEPNPNAKQIIDLAKEVARITGYQLSGNSIVEKQQAVNMANRVTWPVSALPTVVILNT